MLYYVPSVNYPQLMQKYLFILLFLIFSCDEPAIDGSTTTTACNYNIDADKDDGSCLVNDCAGVCGQTATVDNCNRCVGGDIGETACTCYDCDDSECCDCDGNIYETIQIGEQLWMAENLKVTRYNDDSEIQYVQKELSEPDVWANLSTGAYGYYNDDLSNSDTYGNLYNWYAVDADRVICPNGWHVPRTREFIHVEV